MEAIGAIYAPVPITASTLYYEAAAIRRQRVMLEPSRRSLAYAARDSSEVQLGQRTAPMGMAVVQYWQSLVVGAAGAAA